MTIGACVSSWDLEIVVLVKNNSKRKHPINGLNEFIGTVIGLIDSKIKKTDLRTVETSIISRDLASNPLASLRKEFNFFTCKITCFSNYKCNHLYF